jgi:hypothetical protein
MHGHNSHLLTPPGRPTPPSGNEAQEAGAEGAGSLKRLKKGRHRASAPRTGRLSDKLHRQIEVKRKTVRFFTGQFVAAEAVESDDGNRRRREEETDHEDDNSDATLESLIDDSEMDEDAMGADAVRQKYRYVGASSEAIISHLYQRGYREHQLSGQTVLQKKAEALIRGDRDTMKKRRHFIMDSSEDENESYNVHSLRQRVPSEEILQCGIPALGQHF